MITLQEAIKHLEHEFTPDTLVNLGALLVAIDDCQPKKTETKRILGIPDIPCFLNQCEIEYEEGVIK